MVVVDADAGSYVIALLADSVGPARRRFAGVDGFFLQHDTLYKRIASVSVCAGADNGMIDHDALGVLRARAWARIRTLGIDARFVRRTVRVDETLRATGWWRSYVSGQARAGWVAVDVLTLSVWSARRRTARISRVFAVRYRCEVIAALERIPSLSRKTAADGRMIDHFASGVQTAGAQARVRALLVHTGACQRTFRTDHALRSTGWRRTKVSLKTGADCVVLDVATLTVWPTGRGRAWVPRGLRDLRLLTTGNERIAHVTRWAGAARYVVDNVANSALTTGPRTGILAFVPETCFIARTLQVEDTFRAAGFVGVAQVFRKTLALAIPAESVGTAWRWTARVTDSWYSGRRHHEALRERVTSESFHAGADRNVVQNVALSIDAAGTWTRILTLLVDAGEVALALGAQDAFWSTFWRHADVIW